MAVPVELRRLFDRSLPEEDEDEQPQTTPTKPLFPGDVRYVDFNTMGGAGVDEVVKEDPITKIQDIVLSYLFPPRVLTKPADRTTSRAFSFSSSAKGLQVEWDRVNKHEHAEIESQTIELLNWIDNEFKKDIPKSLKITAAGMIMELMGTVLAIGSKLDLLHLDWNNEESTFWDISVINPSILTPDIEGVENNENIDWTPAAPAPPQQIFTSLILRCFRHLEQHGSDKEQYVMFISLLQSPSIEFEGKLRCLETLARVLRSFPTKRASYLITVNTTILSVLLSKGHIVEQAEASLQRIMDGEEVMFDSRPPYYLAWLSGVTRFLSQYFSLLGDAVAEKQADDFHGVGPNACASLLSKLIVVVSSTYQHIRVNSSLHPSWDPLDSASSISSPLLPKWMRFINPFLFSDLSDAIGMYSFIPGSGILTELEIVNIVSPLTDGCGELETTPVATAVVGAWLTLHSEALGLGTNGEKYWRQVQLPLVLSAQRYTSLGFSFCFVLLRASQLLLKAQVDTPGFTCLVCDTPDSSLFHFRRKRVAELGLECFVWACLAPGCLKSVPDSFFVNLHGMAIRPPQLIASILAGLAHAPTDPGKMLKRLLLTDCITPLIMRYSLPIRFTIMQSIPGMSVGLWLPPSRSSTGTAAVGAAAPLLESFNPSEVEEVVLTAITHLMKETTLKSLIDLGQAGVAGVENVKICCDAIVKFGCCLLDGSAMASKLDDAILTYISCLQSIYIHPHFQTARASLLNSPNLTKAINAVAKQVDIEESLKLEGQQKTSLSLLKFSLSELARLSKDSVNLSGPVS